MLWDVPGIWIPGCKICSHEKYTPGSTNMAGWKMDPDWVEVFPIENGGISSNCYVSLLEGNNLNPQSHEGASR